MEPFLDQNISYFGQKCEPKLKFLTCFKKLRKWRLRVLESQNYNISTIKYKPCYDFLGLEFFEIFSGLPSTFRVIFESFWYKTRQKIKYIILLCNIAYLFNFYQYFILLVKKRVSGLPNLKNGAWNFFKNHSKLKHICPLVM